jgi:hypothetical protein
VLASTARGIRAISGRSPASRCGRARLAVVLLSGSVALLPTPSQRRRRRDGGSIWIAFCLRAADRK